MKKNTQIKKTVSWVGEMNLRCTQPDCRLKTTSVMASNLFGGGIMFFPPVIIKI